MQAPEHDRGRQGFSESQSLGSSAIPTLKKPREQVQTGGFGDPNGVPTNGKTNRNPNIAGRAASTCRRARASEMAQAERRARRASWPAPDLAMALQWAVTAEEITAPCSREYSRTRRRAAAPKVKQTAAVSNTKPVEILFKPKPVYTDEGRAKKIEGDVLLQVVFTAAGEVKVERVVQGLGYGLDESAKTAARQIRFQPAMQDGQPVDFPAVAHITFELAY